MEDGDRGVSWKGERRYGDKLVDKLWLDVWWESRVGDVGWENIKAGKVGGQV